MTADGVMKFLDELCLSPESRVVLLIAWKFKAATQCEFTKEEFVTGMTEIGYKCFVSGLKLEYSRMNYY